MPQLSFTALAVMSACFGAIATVLARTLLKDLKSKDILGINFFTMGITLVLVSPLFYKFTASVTAIGLIILIAIIDTAANYYFFKTFEETEASVAAPILSLAPAFTFMFSWLFLSDSVSGMTFLYAILIIIGIIIFSTDTKNLEKFKVATLKPALTSSILFGLSAIPSKYLLSTMAVINAPTLYMFRAGFIGLFCLLLFKFTINHITIVQYRIIFVRCLFVIVQWVLLYYALTIGNAGVTVTLANITPIFVFILGAVFLKEKITIKKIITAGLIIILSLAS